jgi:fermentation-respiration switch protein FrsA (DUF1100 family)
LRKSTAVVGSVAGLIVLAYALGCAYLWSQQTRFIFMPARDITSTPADTGLPYEDVFIPRFDSLSKVDRLRVPVLYLHGTDDSVAPFDMSRRLYERTRAPKRLQLILGGGHNNSARVGGSVYIQAVKEFLDIVASDGNTPRLQEKHS